jgi:hypothetical protein
MKKKQLNAYDPSEQQKLFQQGKDYKNGYKKQTTLSA